MRYQFVDCRWALGEPERGRDLYLEGHIPGASFLDVDTDLSAPAGPRGRHPLPGRTSSSAQPDKQASVTASSSSPTGTWAAPSVCGGCCATTATTPVPSLSSTAGTAR